MTEEELKKKGEQINAANQQQAQQAPQPTNVPTPAAITDNNQSSVAQSVADMRQRAADYRDYASRPVTIDKSGQTNWLNEIERVRNQYVETPEQKAARERREKRDRRIASIADGLVAISNVAGAMAGATPVKPATTMSMAHKAAVDAAAKKRRENLNQYDIARRYYAGLQYKQDKDNADQLYKKAKARQDAGKQADLLDMNATKIEQAQANADRSHEETVRSHKANEQIKRERNAKVGSRGGGGSNTRKSSDLQAAYDYWQSLTEAEKQEYRKLNKRIQQRSSLFDDNTSTAKDDENFIKLVWEQRKAYLRNNGRAGEIASGGFNIRNKTKKAAASKNKPNSKNIKWNGNKKRNSYI